MARKVHAGRYTATPDEQFVVFLIGMRINHWFALHKWVPTFVAMSRMLRVLTDHPETGFLGGEAIFYPRGVGLIQYWRSFDQLEHFAREPTEPHMDAWRRFNRVIGSDGSVGFWHESYLVEPATCEAVYGNMPCFGLAAATNHQPAIGRRETARTRLGGHSEPGVPSPPQPTP